MKTLIADGVQVDSVITDPPYGLKFMGRKWDYSVPSVETWQLVYQLLKPGGHVLSFGGTRTYHRMVVNLEDAGFEIRDQINWIHGQGFPKSQDISKAIDKQAGATREITGSYGRSFRPHSKDTNPGWDRPSHDAIGNQTAPATPEAAQWAGYGTALKPACEPIVMARKPFDGTTAANVIKHGTGGINIDGCRVGTAGGCRPEGPGLGERAAKNCYGDGLNHYRSPAIDGLGRWPSNIILDAFTFAKVAGAKYFYCAKASQAERGGSKHPTVKPVSLMRYLCRLITPKNGLILDPFGGSGTTAEAAELENFNSILIERDPQYVTDIHARMEPFSNSLYQIEWNYMEDQKERYAPIA